LHVHLSPASCKVPRLENGRVIYNESNGGQLLSKKEVESNQYVTVECERGFNIQGPSLLHCFRGKWSVSNFPICISSPCVLPYSDVIFYEGGYRAGLTIAHESEITAHCISKVNKTILVTCYRGKTWPTTFNCSNRLRKSSDQYPSKDKSIESSEKSQPPLDSLSKTSLIKNDIVADVPRKARYCGPPNKVEGALVYKNNEEPENDEGYPNGTEIFFNCIASVSNERNTWKIICENGNWIGRSYSCANGTCLFHNNERNVVSFYNDLEIREDIVEFPPGATIISRCADIGKYAMVGNKERTCIHSEWTTNQPTCFGLNQENDYAMEKPPTILFRHQNGPIAQSNDGKLIVYPGTTLHMECLWMRRFGNPKWNVSNSFRTYPEGWVTDADEGRDSSLEYRLSIIEATEGDSGIFTCQTPARHEHSIEVVVKIISCPAIPVRRGLIININDTKMGSRVNLSCANGNSLIGASEIICLPSGNWSAPLPVCESIECGDINMHIENKSTPRVAVLSREVGGRASFSCSSGYGLRGPIESICLPTGEWALPFPTCVEVQCDDPGAPENGYAQGSAPYRAGDVVQLNCNPEFMMQGQPIIACQDSGRWSGGLPKCVQACSYPGTVISGRMSSVKFYYTIGESITFSCDVGLELRGATMVKCLKNGKWSNAIPTCISLETVNKSRMLSKD
ncbi:sushi, von Willebrand factor type A, EGF and pentraxin domain-containing protein 1-like, partial [Eupeodes corollae]|uniref:sushi, von Willebrand factor type A, EGF and pentraxin domain-containing protein 1-like n=1 Tax=Eupeodes corollae TaxID=290404 RepID=UPI00248F6556